MKKVEQNKRRKAIVLDLNRKLKNEREKENEKSKQ